jgi:flagellar hook-associated protein 2
VGTVFATGIGSGLDIDGLVNQLVAAEGQPKTVRLDSQEAKLQAKISAVGSLRSSLDSLRAALAALKEDGALAARSVTLSAPEFLNVTASSSAVAGTYDIEVDQLATVHRLSSDPFTSAADEIGTGTLNLSIGGQVFSVEIDAENNTLAGIRDAINESSSNTGIGATLISGVDGVRLILTGQQTGAANTMVVTQAGGDGGLAAIVYDPANTIENLTESQAAADARIFVNSFAVEGPGNTITGAVDGLDIELLSINPDGETTRASVARDDSNAVSGVAALVAKYGELVGAAQSATAFNLESQTAGPLLGDALLGNVMIQLRREMNSPYGDLGTPFRLLSSLGISVELDGKLKLDEAKFKAALDADFDAVVDFFSDPVDGLAARMDAFLEPYLSDEGVLDSRADGLKASVELIDEQRELLNQQLRALEARLFRQFNAMDTLLAQLNSTSQFLAQQLNNLPGFTYKGNQK